MIPYRSSLSGRIFSAAVAVALIGGGLVPAFGIDPSIGLPLALLLAVTGGIVALVLGVHSHTAAVAWLAIVSPLVLWPYVMALLWITQHAPNWGLAFVAAGLLTIALNLWASILDRNAVEIPHAHTA
jgi:hypothetical protein